MSKIRNTKYEIRNTGQRGFTLLETIVALFVLAVGVGGAFVFLQQSVTVVPDPIGRVEALYLAQEGVEITRNIRDTNFAKIADAQSVNWLDGLTGCETGCEADYQSEALVPSQDRTLYRNSDGFYDYDMSGEETSFRRTIIVEPEPGSDIIKANVVVEVKWEVRGFPRSARVSTHIYNWLQ